MRARPGPTLRFDDSYGSLACFIRLGDELPEVMGDALQRAVAWMSLVVAGNVVPQSRQLAALLGQQAGHSFLEGMPLPDVERIGAAADAIIRLRTTRTLV